MKGTFEFKLKDGRTCKLDATYECVMKNEISYFDGYEVVGEPKPEESVKCNLVAYVEGKEVDSCRNPSSWRLIDIREAPGKKKIQGLIIAFSNPEEAKRYEKWIAEIIDGGKSDEVKAYERTEKEKKIKRKVESAKKTIKEAERQKDIPTRAEAKRRMKSYNDFMNEGGEGYVPYIISLEEYEYAKEIVEKYGE